MTRFLSLVCAGLLVSISSQAFAQDNSFLIPKAMRSGYVGHSAATHLRHARDHAVILNHLVTNGTPTSDEMVKEQSQAIRAKSEAALKDFAKLKELHAGEKEVAKSIDAIEKHHDQVVAMCKLLDATKGTSDTDKAQVHDCCRTIIKELDAANKEAAKLHETLKISPLKDQHDTAQK